MIDLFGNAVNPKWPDALSSLSSDSKRGKVEKVTAVHCLTSIGVNCLGSKRFEKI